MAKVWESASGDDGWWATIAPMTSRTRVVLIRHGESNAQVAGLVSDHSTCTGLSPRGVKQAAALAHRLSHTGEFADTDVLHTSLLLRAKQTADSIAAAVGAPPIHQSCDWCEIHPGSAEGLTWDQMRIQFPPVGDPDDPSARRLPNMETWAEMYERVGQRLRTVADERAGGTVVAVTSGGPIGASFVAFGKASHEQGIALTRKTQNTSITEWHHVGRNWNLIRHSDATHLDVDS